MTCSQGINPDEAAPFLDTYIVCSCVDLKWTILNCLGVSKCLSILNC